MPGFHLQGLHDASVAVIALHRAADQGRERRISRPAQRLQVGILVQADYLIDHFRLGSQGVENLRKDVLITCRRPAGTRGNHVADDFSQRLFVRLGVWVITANQLTQCCTLNQTGLPT